MMKTEWFLPLNLLVLMAYKPKNKKRSFRKTSFWPSFNSVRFVVDALTALSRLFNLDFQLVLGISS